MAKATTTNRLQGTDHGHRFMLSDSICRRFHDHHVQCAHIPRGQHQIRSVCVIASHHFYFDHWQLGVNIIGRHSGTKGIDAYLAGWVSDWNGHNRHLSLSDHGSRIWISRTPLDSSILFGFRRIRQFTGHFYTHILMCHRITANRRKSIEISQHHTFTHRLIYWQVRGFGLAFSIVSINMAIFVSSKVFPILMEALNLYGIMSLHAVVCAFGTVFVAIMLEETNGRNLDEIGVDKWWSRWGEYYFLIYLWRWDVERKTKIKYQICWAETPLFHYSHESVATSNNDFRSHTCQCLSAPNSVSNIAIVCLWISKEATWSWKSTLEFLVWT